MNTTKESNEALKTINSTKAKNKRKSPKPKKKMEKSNEVLTAINDDKLLDSIQLPEKPDDTAEGSNNTEEEEGSNESGEVPTDSLVEVAHGKAKEIIDASFHLFLALAILLFQHRNCQINGNVIPDFYNYGNATISDLYDCNVVFELSHIDGEYMITLGIGIYSLVAGMIVVIHAILIRDKEKPVIQGIFSWTDRIPVIDCILEIPICLYIAPFITLFLWVMHVTCSVGLLILIIKYGEADHVDGNMSAFILTAILVSFDLYRLTGDIAQYYVINKAAENVTRMKKKKIIERLLKDKSKTSYEKVDEAV